MVTNSLKTGLEKLFDVVCQLGATIEHTTSYLFGDIGTVNPVRVEALLEEEE